MAYEQQTWVDYPDTSTPISAARLNHMEEGIANAGSIRTGTDAPTGGKEGDVYFQVTDTKIINIWQKVNGTWLSLQQAVSIGNLQRVNPTVSLSIANHV